ncbi:ABC transporter permease [Brachybacterium sacelli]|uniref:Peptide/nickel transport system permease protein n=1 Tax=Brachybacterium sacelli TaxID=173364 RepID=A0ABS4X0I5_9MICO|nr:ABC transporter permease [Brachybacterium sacelli]MBP2381962.1 peptide/nickel transport system permease protein [Brachybacterium sacelli]
MILYVLRRFVNYLILTCVATTFSYMAASTFLNPAKKYQGVNPPVPEESIAALMRKYGVYREDPVALRTWNWIENIVTAPFHEKLGMSLSNKWVITEMLGKPENALTFWQIEWLGRAGVSLRLLLIGSLLGAILGVILGVWGAVRQYKFSDQVISYASFILISTPTFVGGLLLMILATHLNRLLGFQLIRFSGAYSPGYEGWGAIWDLGIHLLLPTIALMMFGAAGYSRYQRAVMLDVLGSDFIRTARAKGATRTRALIKHGVRVALIPMSTYFAYQFGTLIAGSTFLEVIFSWAGMGQYGIQAVQTSDINAMAGVVCFASVLVLFASTLSEILYAALDPRVRM